MVKAALLYADSVTLTTPKLTVLRHHAANARPDAEFRAAVEASGVTKLQGWGAAYSTYQGVLLGHRPTAEGEEWLQRFAEELAIVERLREDFIARQLSAAGGAELQSAVDAGHVQLRPIPGDVTDPIRYSAEVAEHLEEVFEEALDATAPTYPLFDVMAWLSLRPTVQTQSLTPSQMAPANEVALAARLIVDELEAFPDAAMSDVLDVRDRLSGPLIRFRGALAKAAGEMESTGFDAVFEREAQALYRREVAPALEELREGFIDLGARETLRRAGEGAVAALGIAAAGALTFSKLIAAALVPVGASGGLELKHRREVREAERANNYFFLWRADELLARRGQSRRSS